MRPVTSAASACRCSSSVTSCRNEAVKHSCFLKYTRSSDRAHQMLRRLQDVNSYDGINENCARFDTKKKKKKTLPVHENSKQDVDSCRRLRNNIAKWVSEQHPNGNVTYWRFAVHNFRNSFVVCTFVHRRSRYRRTNKTVSASQKMTVDASEGKIASMQDVTCS
jgi:hypothetical protein